MYVGGQQENFTAQAKWQERGLKLATKWYPTEPGLHKPEILKQKVHESLKELDTNQVDVFYLHAADRSVPFEETLEAVNDLHKEGKFIEFALSNFTAFEVAEVVLICKMRGWVRPTLYQAMYNAISMWTLAAAAQVDGPSLLCPACLRMLMFVWVIARAIEPELIPACRRYGLDIVIYNPLAGGLFSGKYKTSDVPAEGRYSDSVGHMGSMYRKRYFKDSTFEALRLIEPVVQKHNLTLLETAFRWVVHHSALKISNGNDGVIIGVSSFDQLKGNLADLEKGPLPDEVVQALDEAWLVAKPYCPNYWHLDLEYTYDTLKALFGV